MRFQNKIAITPIRFSPVTLDPSAAVEADIFVAEDGRPWRAPTWPSADGVAIILCPRGGELDDEGHPFCLLGGPSDGENGCIECKGAGYMFVGL
jgi:hypothetical protein